MGLAVSSKADLRQGLEAGRRTASVGRDSTDTRGQQAGSQSENRGDIGVDTHSNFLHNSPERIVELTRRLNALLDLNVLSPIEGIHEVKNLLLRYRNSFLNFGGQKSFENTVAPSDAVKGGTIQEFAQGLSEIDKVIGTL